MHEAFLKQIQTQNPQSASTGTEHVSTLNMFDSSLSSVFLAPPPVDEWCVPQLCEEHTSACIFQECALARSFCTKRCFRKPEVYCPGREGGAESSASLLRYKTCRDMFDSSLSSVFLAPPPVDEWCVPQLCEEHTSACIFQECALARSFCTKRCFRKPEVYFPRLARTGLQQKGSRRVSVAPRSPRSKTAVGKPHF